MFKLLISITLCFFVFNAFAQETYRNATEAVDAEDYIAAFSFWSRDAKKGDSSAQFNLALLYQFGIGVEKSIKDAVYWYEIAARAGDAKAQNNLGHLFYEGQSVLKDVPRAVELFEKSARQGNANAQLNLSRAYTSGVGIQLDLLKGYIWLSMADKSDLGSNSERVQKDLMELSQFLTEKQLSLAKIMITSCWDTSFEICDVADTRK